MWKELLFVRSKVQFIDNVDNPCLEYCGLAPCCQDMWFENIDEANLNKLILHSAFTVRVSAHEELQILDAQKRNHHQGVYFFEKGINKYNAVIVGRCPNLGADNRCGIYDQRPEHCRNFEVGGRECDEARRCANIKPLSVR